MTLTVENSEMTSKNVEHFKITAMTSVHWVIPARTQEEYKQKKKFSPRPHAHSHTFRHISTLTHMTVAHMHTSTLLTCLTCLGKKKTLLTHLGNKTKQKKKKKKKNSSSCTVRLKKKIQCKTSFYLKRVRERYQWSRGQGQWRQPLL